MNNLFFRVDSKDAAIHAIERDIHKRVQLDYPEGGADVLELGRLGRKYGCAVSFYPQIPVSVKSAEALKRELDQPKNTYQQRLIGLKFCVDNSDIEHFQEQASRFGDFILRSSDLPCNSASLMWE
ncbi:MAG: hypothetical protein CML20_12625 [Rheinheimera sp.]|nr:hypothetical protein [Rheinheimera sp.]